MAGLAGAFLGHWLRAGRPAGHTRAREGWGGRMGGPSVCLPPGCTLSAFLSAFATGCLSASWLMSADLGGLTGCPTPITDQYVLLGLGPTDYGFWKAFAYGGSDLGSETRHRTHAPCEVHPGNAWDTYAYCTSIGHKQTVASIEAVGGKPDDGKRNRYRTETSGAGKPGGWSPKAEAIRLTLREPYKRQV